MPGSPEGRPLAPAAPEEERPSSKAARPLSFANPSEDARSLELAPQDLAPASVEARAGLAPLNAGQKNVDAILAPWLVPGYKPPIDATPAARTYAKKVAALSTARPKFDPSIGLGHSESLDDDPIIDLRLDHKRVSKPANLHRASSLSASPSSPPARPSVSSQITTSPGRIPSSLLMREEDPKLERLGMQPPVGQITERQLHERAVDRPEYETDSSQRAAAEGKSFAKANASVAEVVVVAPPGQPTLKAAYFFSGKSRKSSVGEELRKLAVEKGVGLIVYEVDILNGGGEHDLLDKTAQYAWEARVKDGEFDILFLTPPCASWSRSLCRPGGPCPVRDRSTPWGFPHALEKVRKRARLGNEFIHFTIRMGQAAKAARPGVVTRWLLEHPEDLGKTPNGGDPASIWQLPDVHDLVDEKKGFKTVAGH